MSETTGLLVAVSKIAWEVGERDPRFRRRGCWMCARSCRCWLARWRNTALG